MAKPIYDKMCLNSIPVFYRMGFVFRDKNDSKKYYTEGEVEGKIKTLEV